MNADLEFLELVTPQLIERYDRPGPRYTSYPTAVEFTERFTETEYRERLAMANRRAGKALSLYIHIPFCERRCAFCGCSTIVSKDRQRSREYLSFLSKELDLIAQLLPERRELVQYHWGGGTPTYLDLEQMAELQAEVTSHFRIAQNAEVAIEVNPDVTSVDQLQLARELGFNRISLGIQDFNPEVLEASGRKLRYESARDLLEAARELGFESVNFDLIYGLPKQRIETFAKTLEHVIALRPDRVAVYSFAYVPWIRSHQKRINIDTIPDRETKFALFALAVREFLRAGYLQIGMDHFALPDDEMGRAVSNRALFRNFMGYTVHRATAMVGVGLTSISSLESCFAQNQKKLPEYYKALEAGRLPTERGFSLGSDDLTRQRIITELMCNFYLDFKELNSQLGIDCETYFSSEIAKLRATDGMVKQGFVEIDDEGLAVTPLGRLFIRNVCMIFDTYLDARKGGGPVFSRTV